MLSAGQLIFNKKPKQEEHQEVKEELEKEEVKQEEVSRQKLEKLVEQSSRILLKVSTVFPFDLFPDDVIIDENKVSIIFREFFGSERVHSIMIKDISDVFVETSPFFATLRIIDEGFIENSIDIKNLKKQDAHLARRLIQGLIVVSKGVPSTAMGAIDLSLIDKEDLVGKIEELGKTVTS